MTELENIKVVLDYLREKSNESAATDSTVFPPFTKFLLS